MSSNPESTDPTFLDNLNVASSEGLADWAFGIFDILAPWAEAASELIGLL